MGTGDRSYIYGDSNGASYVEATEPGDHDMRTTPTEVLRRTHWDTRIEVSNIGGMGVQIGIVPPSKEHSTDEQGVWDSEDGTFMCVSRDGLNRLIRALKEQGEIVFGRDEW